MVCGQTERKRENLLHWLIDCFDWFNARPPQQSPAHIGTQGGSPKRMTSLPRRRALKET